MAKAVKVREVEVYVPKINKKIYIYKHTIQRWRLFHTHPPRQDFPNAKNKFVSLITKY